jgi:hypothetical protein
MGSFFRGDLGQYFTPRPIVKFIVDVLPFNRTNSKELVGKCGIFSLTGEYVFASYLIRVRLKHGTLLPDYVTAFLSSSFGRIQIDAVSRQIAGMTNINAEEIRELLIPILDHTTQEKSYIRGEPPFVSVTKS